MKPKQIAILVIFILFVLPLLIKVFIWFVSIGADSSQSNLDKGADLLAETAVPWWIGVFDGLSNLGTLGAILIIFFVAFLIWTGEIRPPPQR